MRHIVIFLLLVNVESLFGQSFNYPIIKSEANELKGFIPEDWNLYDSISGDLSKDGFKDKALVIENRDIKFVNTESFQHFILIIVFYDNVNNKYILKAQCNDLISYHQKEPGPFYESMEIDRGILNISYYKGGGSDITFNYKFRFQENEFYLIGADINQSSQSNQDFKNYSFNFLSKKWSITTGNDESGVKPKVEWRKLKIEKLMKLKDYKGPYSWEVVKGINI